MPKFYLPPQLPLAKNIQFFAEIVLDTPLAHGRPETMEERHFWLVIHNDRPESFAQDHPLVVRGAKDLKIRKVADWQLGQNKKFTVLFEDGELVEGFE